MATRSRSVSAETACCKTSPHVPRSEARGNFRAALDAAEAIMDVVVDGLTFPEAPRWRDGKLWFSDFYTQRVLTVDGRGTLETVVEVPQRPSGLGWTPEGALLVVSMLDRRLLRVDGGKLRVVADLSALATGPCNDMVVDAMGRAYVGNFGFDRHRGEPPRTTCLARVDPDRRALRVRLHARRRGSPHAVPVHQHRQRSRDGRQARRRDRERARRRAR